MKINTRYVYDRTTERLYCCYGFVQVVMARGKICNWKQLVYYYFDQNTTKTPLFSIINSIEEAGYEVWGTVCDMGRSKSGIFSALGITTAKNCSISSLIFSMERYFTFGEKTGFEKW